MQAWQNKTYADIPDLLKRLTRSATENRELSVGCDVSGIKTSGLGTSGRWAPSPETPAERALRRVQIQLGSVSHTSLNCEATPRPIKRELLRGQKQRRFRAVSGDARSFVFSRALVLSSCLTFFHRSILCSYVCLVYVAACRHLFLLREAWP